MKAEEEEKWQKQRNETEGNVRYAVVARVTRAANTLGKHVFGHTHTQTHINTLQ